MASVNVVYNTLKDLANKEQKGFVTPQVFNNFAQLAQVNVFRSLFDKMQKAKIMRLRNADESRELSMVNNIKEDLSTFVTTAVVPKNGEGTFDKPEDMVHVVGLTTNGSIILGQSTRTPIEILYDESKIDYILTSDLSAPSEEHPIGLVSDTIEVFPSSINKIRVSYYKYPQGILPLTGGKTAALPVYGYTTTNGVNVFQPSTSVDFEMPDHYVGELVIEMAKLIGINLRDRDVFTYGQTEDVKRSK